MSGFSEDGRLSNSNNALLHKTNGKMTLLTSRIGLEVNQTHAAT